MQECMTIRLTLLPRKFHAQPHTHTQVPLPTKMCFPIGSFIVNTMAGCVFDFNGLDGKGGTPQVRTTVGAEILANIAVPDS